MEQLADGFVLSDPRLPPLEDPVDDSGYELRATSMAEVEAGLRGVLGRLAADAGRWILIIEIGPTPGMIGTMECATGVCMRAYLQWLCFEDGSFVAEVSSNASLHPSHQVSTQQEAELLDLGWDAPRPPDQPNFSVVYLDPQRAADAAALAVRTMIEVFGVAVDEPLLVKLCESSHRGPTPLTWDREEAC
jgi:hypothetical protein